jgi:hypothetical protein
MSRVLCKLEHTDPRREEGPSRFGHVGAHSEESRERRIYSTDAVGFKGVEQHQLDLGACAKAVNF